MITPEFLQSCTDEQINKGVAWLEAKSLEINNLNWVISNLGDIFVTRVIAFNPCQVANDAWPIILSNCISIECDEGVWSACSGVRYDSSYYYPVKSWDIEVVNKNPIRAAMEVYILMSTSK
jgi:hypothetical protein